MDGPDASRVVQDSLGEGGLAAVDMRADANVPGGGQVLCHGRRLGSRPVRIRGMDAGHRFAWYLFGRGGGRRATP